MDKATAVRKLHKIIGKGFGYQLNPKALDKDGREAAKAELKTANAEKDRASAALEARRQELLAGDQDYQAKLVAYRAARKHAEKLSSQSYACRITVGTTDRVGGFGFFHVKADGDNWQEVLDKVTKG